MEYSGRLPDHSNPLKYQRAGRMQQKNMCLDIPPVQPLDPLGNEGL